MYQYYDTLLNFNTVRPPSKELNISCCFEIVSNSKIKNLKIKIIFLQLKSCLKFVKKIKNLS